MLEIKQSRSIENQRSEHFLIIQRLKNNLLVLLVYKIILSLYCDQKFRRKSLKKNNNNNEEKKEEKK